MKAFCAIYYIVCFHLFVIDTILWCSRFQLTGFKVFGFRRILIRLSKARIIRKSASGLFTSCFLFGVPPSNLKSDIELNLALNQRQLFL